MPASLRILHKDGMILSRECIESSLWLLLLAVSISGIQTKKIGFPTSDESVFEAGNITTMD
jgi:hypothetical protein